MTPREIAEYQELRATIRQRGTARVLLASGGLVAWAALSAVAGSSGGSSPWLHVLPTVGLAGLFEGVLTLHLGAERIGRYLQVFFEDPEETGRWESAAMAFGRPLPGGSDPLFAALFLAAGLVGVGLAFTTPSRPGAGLATIAYALFAVRVFVARRGASRQRALDLARFTEIRASGATRPGP